MIEIQLLKKEMVMNKNNAVQCKHCGVKGRPYREESLMEITERFIRRSEELKRQCKI